MYSDEEVEKLLNLEVRVDLWVSAGHEVVVFWHGGASEEVLVLAASDGVIVGGHGAEVLVLTASDGVIVGGHSGTSKEVLKHLCFLLV